MKKTILGKIILTLALTAVYGWGCGNPTVQKDTQLPSGLSGPKVLVAANLSADDLTKKINLASGSVVVLKQEYSGQGLEMAKALGIGGKEAKREVVIKRFAPGQLAEVEWKLTYKAADGSNQQHVGALTGADLLSSREMYLPALWPDGVNNSYGLGLLWLSAESYENLTKSGFGTFDFGLTNRTMIDYASTTVGLQAALNKLQTSISDISAKTEVSLSRAATSTTEWPLKVNGTDAKVKVYTAKNWFGEAVFLANQQYPLVLKIKMNELPDGSKLNGLLDYEVTELRDLQE
ncbi:hypothetical protein HZC53_05765 [Candidatus Uhrbacteria bacterium]|nr:hypothetical protein [Candidatus Uhrbacteria bacterium]